MRHAASGSDARTAAPFFLGLSSAAAKQLALTLEPRSPAASPRRHRHRSPGQSLAAVLQGRRCGRAECYTRTAWLYLERLNDVEKAILFYERHVSEYSNDPRSAALLVKIGELHEKNTKNYGDAIGAYRRLAELFPADPLSPEYLLRAADLADTKLNDPVLAASLYEQLTKDYPRSDQGKTAAEILQKRNEN